MLNYKNYICYILDVNESTLDNVLTKSKYYTFKVPKRSGGYRTISAPDKRLKWIQNKLNNYIISKYKFLECQYGFVKEKSIVDNAKVHNKAKYILNIDLKNFFPSINFGRVRGIFLSAPFNLPNYVATTLAKIACYHNELPQGSPVSPCISNIVCYTLDKKLLNLSKQYNFNYTRYADDITLSSNNIFPKEIVTRTIDNYVIIGNKLRSIIEKEGFIINENKTNYSCNNERKEVTGLIVNEKVNIKKVYIKELRALLNRCNKDNLYKASLFYFKIKEVHSLNKKKALIKQIRNVIEGKLNFIAMVRGKEDLVYQKYLKQYLEILHKENIYSHSIRKKIIEDYNWSFHE